MDVARALHDERSILTQPRKGGPSQTADERAARSGDDPGVA